MDGHEHAQEAPRWYVVLGVVPVVTYLAAIGAGGGDPVAALASAAGAQQVAGWLAEVSLRRRGVRPRRAEVLAEHALDPPWLVVPLVPALAWAAVDLVGRVRLDPGDWWSWGFLALAVLCLVAVGHDLASGVRRRRGRRPRGGRGGRAARRPGARVA